MSQARERIRRHLDFDTTARPHTGQGGKIPGSAYLASLLAILNAA